MDALRVRIPIGAAHGQEHFIEAEIEPGPGITLASSGGRLAEAPWTLAEAFDRIGPAIDVILGKLRAQLKAPHEIEVEFGLTLGGEFGVLFTKGTAEASFTVRATWRDDAP
ncbi:CU044_2847 family protein [Nonomuraea fuscirosea]|uniref:CU044_2847 family protein n=1 Tax=Nonomuraea fuscirosea TaxID=1291556 RepID=UPI0033E00ABC